MNIFESLENLNVSEECFDEIMCKVREILDEGLGLTAKLAPKLAGKGRDGESLGTKIERASVKHPIISKITQGIDRTVNNVDKALRKKEPKYKSPDEALKTMTPAGNHFGKDMYSDEQIKYAKEKAKKEKVPTNKYIWQK